MVWFAVRPEEVPGGGWEGDHQVEFEGSALLAGRDHGLRLPFPGRYRLYSAARTTDGPGFLPLYQQGASAPFEVHEHLDGATLELEMVEVIEPD